MAHLNKVRLPNINNLVGESVVQNLLQLKCSLCSPLNVWSTKCFAKRFRKLN